MANNNKWLQKLNPFQSSEVKSLQTQLDKATYKLEDSLDYEAKFYDSEPSTGSGAGMFEYAGIDQVINAAVLQRVYTTETWVYVAVNSIAQTIAGLPIKLEKRRTFKKKVINDITGETEEVDQESWVDASGEKLFKRFQNPNKFTSKAEFYMLLLIDLLTAGQYFVYLDSDIDLTAITSDPEDEDSNNAFSRLRQLMAGDTPIKGMYRIPPSMIKPVPTEDGMSIQGYAMQSDKGIFGFSHAEMVHVKLPNPTLPLEGLSPLIPAFKPVLLDRFSTEHMIRFYKSGARLGGVIETEKTLNKEQLGRFQRSFENNYTGRQNHHRTLILPPGMKYQQIEQNPAETALLDFCKYNRDAVLSAYRVPPIKAGVMDNANYANARIQLKMFFNDTVKPLLTFIEDGFNLKNTLMPDGGMYRIKFDLSQEDSLKEDYLDKAKAAVEMTSAGLTVNEVRKLVWEVGPIDGGNQSLVIAKVRHLELQNIRDTVSLDAERREALTGDGTDSATDDQTPAGKPGAGAGDSVAQTQAQDDIAQNQITDPSLSLNGAQVAAMVDILNRVAQGYLPRATGVELIIASFSVPRDAAERIMGEIGKTFSVAPNGAPAGPKPEAEPPTPPTEPVKAAEQTDTAAIASDIKPTKVSFTDRVNQLTAQYMQEGLPLNLAIAKAIEQAKAEGCTDDTDPDDDGTPPAAPNSDGSGAPDGSTPPAEEGKDGEGLSSAVQGADLIPTMIGTGKPKKPKKPKKDEDEEKDARPSLDAFLADALSILGDAPITADVIAGLVDEYNSNSKGEQSQIQERQVYAFGMSKDKTADHWKSFVTKTHPLMEKRLVEVQKFFKDFKSIVLNRLGANLKAYGLHKARDSDDSDEILKLDAFDALIASYIEQVDKALLEAANMGFGDTLVNFEMAAPNAKAVEALRTYLADKVKGIVGTTQDQLRQVLADAFEKEGNTIADVAKAVTEKFDQISAGRAQTIARTETLTAVSIGSDLKRQEYQAEFPDKKLLKMWVSAQDDAVRDSHQELDGVSVGVDEEFKEGLMYPRDPNGAADEVINCRCTDITFMEEDEQAIRDTAPDNSNQDQSDEEQG